MNESHQGSSTNLATRFKPLFFFVIIIICSSLLFAATTAVWIRSLWRMDQLEWGTPNYDRGVFVFAERGRTILGLNTDSMGRIEHFSSPRPSADIFDSPNLFQFLFGDNLSGWHDIAGFILGWGSWDHFFVVLGAPDWFLTVASIMPAAIAIAKRRRRGLRIVQALCSYCGYDLRASPNLCPECGKPRGTANENRKF